MASVRWIASGTGAEETPATMENDRDVGRKRQYRPSAVADEASTTSVTLRRVDVPSGMTAYAW